MYFILLFAAAIVSISLLTSFWPLKMYHHYLLKDLAAALDSDPKRQGLAFSKVYSEITTNYQGRDFRVRFMEGSADSLKSNTGLEIRLKAQTGAILECYPLRRRKREWGDFKQFLTRDPQVDSEWFILSNNQEQAAEFCQNGKLVEILRNRNFFLEQLSITSEETIARLRRYHSRERVIEFMVALAEVV